MPQALLHLAVPGVQRLRALLGPAPRERQARPVHLCPPGPTGGLRSASCLRAGIRELAGTEAPSVSDPIPSSPPARPHDLSFRGGEGSAAPPHTPASVRPGKLSEVPPCPPALTFSGPDGSGDVHLLPEQVVPGGAVTCRRLSNAARPRPRPSVAANVYIFPLSELPRHVLPPLALGAQSWGN